MSISSRVRNASALLLGGAAIGGTLGYAVGASGAGAEHTSSAGAQQRGDRASRAGGKRSRLRHAVSITAVVPSGDGKFATVSIARGVLVGTSSDSLTLREGTRKATYKTVTLPLSADARVRLSKQASSLGALSAGDLVAVVTGPRRTTIAARPPRGPHASKTSQPAEGGESSSSVS
jgi:hypothetical protein